jgi:lipoprotein-anchoring transpeptidase ErfK/SrfK
MGSGPRYGRICVALAAVLLLGACGSAPSGLAPETSSPMLSPSPIASPSPSPSPSASPSPRPSPRLEPLRVIRISLSAQHLWALDDGKAVVSTDVTTGMPALPTPAGTYRITAMYSPYRFISPWARGSPYYYDPLWVDFAMLFAAGGYFIHDASWQRNFGPGGNLKTGSHGCVNVPPAAMPALYRWARIGDLVVVVA